MFPKAGAFFEDLLTPVFADVVFADVVFATVVFADVEATFDRAPA